MSRRAFERVLIHAVLIGGVALVALPFAWMVLTSLKTLEEANASPPTLLPRVAQWDNYATAWAKSEAMGSGGSFTTYFRNSLWVAACVTAGVLLTSILAGYAFANMEFRGRRVLFLLFLSTMMIPFEVVLVPNYGTVAALGWKDTYWALVVPWLANVFSIFILRQAFQSLPRDFYDAARIDGCGHWRFLWRIAVPMVWPALVTVILFTFLGSWNSFLWPLLVTDSPRMRVVQVGLSTLMGEESTRFNILMAASTTAIVPVVVLYFILQRRFIEGVAGSGVKG